LEQQQANRKNGTQNGATERNRKQKQLLLHLKIGLAALAQPA
jgi:hypothetical protein